MRKILTLTLGMILAFALAFTVGCKKEEQAKITLNKSEITLYVGQDDLLEVQENVAVTFSSNNESVVYVSAGGVVSALKAGTATITAKAGGASATCTVTVLDDVQFSLKNSQVSMAKGDSINLSSQVNRIVNGKNSTAGSLSATSSNPLVASVDGGSIILNQNGNAVITIVWTYNNVEYSAELSVTVENKVFVEVSEPSQTVYAYGQNNTLQLDYSLEVNRQNIPNPQLVWESSNKTVATVSENGLVTGLTYGTVTLTASCSLDGEVFTDSVEITVERLTVASEQTYKFGYKNQNVILSAEDYIGNIQQVTLDKVLLNTETDAQTGDVTVFGSNFSSEGEVTIEILTDKTQTTATFDIVTAILMNAEDLDKMDEYCRPEDWNEDLMKTERLYGYGGTILLGADIDYGGNSYTSEVFYGVSPYTSGHGGIYNNLNFDGQGYAISNIVFADAHRSYLFGYEWRGETTVKNLAILNATVSAGATFVSYVNGSNTIENVYIQVKSNFASGSFSNLLVGSFKDNANPQIKNVIVDVLSATNPDEVSGITRTTSERLNSFDGVYTIGAKVDIGFKKEDGTLAKLAQNNTGYVGGAYQNDVEFMNASAGIFVGDFARAFAIEDESEDVTILKFMGRKVKTLSPFEGDTINYTFGFKQSDLVLPLADFNGEVTDVSIFDGATLSWSKSQTGYVVARTNFATFGTYKIKVTTTTGKYYKTVGVVNAVLTTLSDLQNMQTFASLVDGKYQAKFILGADINCDGYQFNASTEWGNLDFDGQGFTISNYTTATSSGLFGYKIYGKIRNVALIGVSPNGNWAGSISRYLLGTLENIYVSGSITAGIAQASLLCAEINTAARVKNVIVNVENCTRADAMAIGKHAGASGADYKVTNIANTYSIDNSANKNIKHVAYSYKEGTSVKFANITSAKGAYASATDFLADKDTIFTGEFAKVFKLETDGTSTVLKFFDKVVKTF